MISTLSSMPPQEMAQRTGSGLLSFPVTHFNETHDFVEGAYRGHIGFLLEHGPAALFPAGGTGEFFSLTLKEHAQVVAAAVAESARRVPVIAGCGYGTRIAIQFARSAEGAGADGILLLPPYLVKADAAGLIAHTQQVCAATRLGVIFYNRDNAVLDEQALEILCDTCPNLIGLKDGHGDLELITRIRARLGDRLSYIGGLPTAETFALPYLDIGVTTYSSAIFNFLPRFASDFYAAVKNRDQSTILSKLREFVLPYVAIRNRRKGYAVSIVKAGLDVIGRSAGPVRPPLVGLRAGEKDELRALVGDLR